jgi:hypothetical protein
MKMTNMTPGKQLEDVKRWYIDTALATQDNRTKAERDRDYVDLKQWTSEEETALKNRKQPITQSPELKEFVQSIIGYEITSRTDIKGFPRNPDDEDAAESVTDALRYVADNANLDQVKTTCIDDYLVEGTMASIVEIKKGKRGVEIMPRRIPWDRFFIDSHSSRKDGADAMFMGQAIWMEDTAAQAKWPNVDPTILTAGIEEAGGTDTYDDKPKNLFFDRNRHRVKIIEMYYQSGGQWLHCMFTGQGYVVEPHPSDYLDEDGEPANPIEVQRAYMDRDNNPYGYVRQLITIVDEINKRRSKSLHLLSTRQVIADKGAVDSINRARAEVNKPDGYVEKNPGKEFSIEHTGDLASGQFQLLQDAKGSLNSFGGVEQLSGGSEKSLSGRAMQMSQQAAVRGLAPLLDGARYWEKRIYRQIWARIKQFWREEKWIRVTDDENSLKFIALNKPVTFGEMLKEQGQPFDPMNPIANEVHHIENHVAELDIDIILDMVPDVTTLQTETFEAFANAVSASGTQVPLQIWLELMPHVPNKKRLMEVISGGELSPEEAEMKQVEMQKAQQREEEAYQIEKATKVADIRAKLAKAAKDMADTEAQELENDAVESGLSDMLEQVDG